MLRARHLARSQTPHEHASRPARSRTLAANVDPLRPHSTPSVSRVVPASPSDAAARTPALAGPAAQRALGYVKSGVQGAHGGRRVARRLNTRDQSISASASFRRVDVAIDHLLQSAAACACLARGGGGARQSAAVRAGTAGPAPRASIESLLASTCPTRQGRNSSPTGSECALACARARHRRRRLARSRPWPVRCARSSDLPRTREPPLGASPLPSRHPRRRRRLLLHLSLSGSTRCKRPRQPGAAPPRPAKRRADNNASILALPNASRGWGGLPSRGGGGGGGEGDRRSSAGKRPRSRARTSALRRPLRRSARSASLGSAGVGNAAA